MSRAGAVLGSACRRLGAVLAAGLLQEQDRTTVPIANAPWVLWWGGGCCGEGATGPRGLIAACVHCALDPMMDLSGAEHTELDGQQEMEDYEEENSYGYEGVGNPPDDSVLAEQAMKEMAYYNML